MSRSIGVGMVFAAALLAACGEGGTNSDTGGGGGATSSSAMGGGGASSSSSSTASGGGSPAPDWATSLPAGGSWTELGESEPFTAWVKANLEPNAGYVGSAPIDAVRDAYCNPVFDHAGKAFYLFGGGHSDGSVNAVFKLDAATLKYSIVVPPTPPSAYPPAYTAPNSPIVYPSGATNGFFQTAETLTDPADLPYAAPFAAPASSHTYSAMSFVDGKMILHYGPVRVADVVSGKWTSLEKDVYGPQLVKFNPNYFEVVLQAGTRTANDPATGKAWTTLIAGDAGLNWRNRVLEMDPATRTIENVVDAKWEVSGSSSIVIGGPYVYVFTPTNSNGTSTATRGWRIDKATRAVEHLTLTGDLPSWPQISPKQEGIPVFYDGAKMNFWNYSVEADLDAFFRVDLEPKSGAGTEAEPYVLSSTREARPPSGMPSPALTYELTYIAEWGVVLFLPKGSEKLWAIKP
ncbi:hypothetical protein [Polyangium jinanense]|uniref:DUF4185 domain-containing protein n=1 Tax=Polyangium jinanense TaxID=2829994 RepID=A0A9X3XGM4_9BACT|nr:hypothetical protein [Polyangium jinanense]MDC3962586.1 hypothetical protein [Polyangium jinanense]MDC3988738.1 hypothetical protein [Polyangium jinanense]